MNLSDEVRMLGKRVAELTKLILNVRGTGGGGGEANTASNQGAGGVGLYHSKVGVDLQFKNINAGSAKVTVTNDVPNKEVDIDVVQPQIDHGSIGGLGDDDHTIYLLASGARALGGNWALGGFNLTGGGTIYSDYYILGAAPAATGRIRLPNNAVIKAKAAGAGDVNLIYDDGADKVRVGDSGLEITAGVHALPSCVLVGGDAVVIGETLQVEAAVSGGRIAMKETTDPALKANYGKIWVRSSDSKLYFMDDSGNIYELTAAGTISTENFMPRPHLGRNWRMIQPYDSNAGIGVGCVTVVTVGGQTNQLDANGFWVAFRNNGLVGNVAIVRTATYDYCQPQHNPHAYFLVKTPADITNLRYWIGFSTAQMPRNATNNNNSIAMRFHTTVPDANWMFCLTDNAGAQTDQNTGVAVAASTVYLIQIWTGDGGVTWNWDINGTSASNVNNVPLTTASWGLMIEVIGEEAVQKFIWHGLTYWLVDLG